MASALHRRYSNSLLPYLQGASADAGLRLSLFSAGSSHRDLAFPFDVLDDTPAVSRFIEAGLVTDAGSSLKKIVLQVQKDRYALPVDQLRPVTNLDVDRSWRRAFSSAASQKNGRARVLFTCQLDEGGELVPLASLFFCRERGLYFHPPCPGCGLPLRLCTDDGLLERVGLAPYSRSLKRYLHCSSCASDAPADFYQYELDHADPLAVKDRWALIDQFRLIESCQDTDGGFPCVGCPQRYLCYGKHPAVRERVVPFSFYPFYLLISEAPPLHALDFLQLAASAGVEELVERLDAQLAYCREISGSIDALRGEIKAAIFAAPSHHEVPLVVETLQESPALAPAPRMEEVDETMETVILQSKRPGAIHSPAALSGISLEEICVLPRFCNFNGPPQVGVPEPAGDGMLETMLSAPPGAVRQAAPDEGGSCVLVEPQGAGVESGACGAVPPPAGKDAARDDGAKDAAREEGGTPSPVEAAGPPPRIVEIDQLAETIFIKPMGRPGPRK
jgi:hypothetical protein